MHLPKPFWIVLNYPTLYTLFFMQFQKRLCLHICIVLFQISRKLKPILLQQGTPIKSYRVETASIFNNFTALSKYTTRLLKHFSVGRSCILMSTRARIHSGSSHCLMTVAFLRPLCLTSRTELFHTLMRRPNWMEQMLQYINIWQQ